MAIPVAIIGTFVKGFVGLFQQFGIPLAAFFAGKKSAEAAQMKKEIKNDKIASKLKDGVSRADDDKLDSVLRD